MHLNVFTAFSGYDSQCLGLNRLKEYNKDFSYDLVGWSEIDKYPIIAHNALFPEYADRNYGDISKIDWNTVPDFDLFTYSSPCFIAGTQITVSPTKTKSIEDIKVGDLVFTHKNRYMKVTEVMSHKHTGIMIEFVSANGDSVICTPNHPFLCVDKLNEKDEVWIEAKDIDIEQHNAVMYYKDKWYGDEYLTFNEIYEKRIFVRFAPVTVYNLEVEEDHSYIANNYAVHNCTDFSAAGKQAGGAEGSGTRSSLLWECKKAIEIKRPKYLLFENVLGLLQQKFMPYFLKWISLVNSYGYNSYYAVLNAKDYGLPHNRPRVFLVSIRKDLNIKFFHFPNPINEFVELYSILEPDEDVDKKFYCSDKRRLHYLELNKDAIEKIEQVEKPVANYDVKPYGCYCHSSDPFNAPPLLNYARCLKTESIESGILYKQDGIWKQRLFTYKEMFRLQGLKDEEYEKIKANINSVTALGRMAGNSIAVNVLFHIFRKMFIDTNAEIGQEMPLF